MTTSTTGGNDDAARETKLLKIFLRNCRFSGEHSAPYFQRMTSSTSFSSGKMNFAPCCRACHTSAGSRSSLTTNLVACSMVSGAVSSPAATLLSDDEIGHLGSDRGSRELGE